MVETVDSAPLPIIQDPEFKAFSMAIYVVSALLSLLAFLYGLVIVYLDRRVWYNHIVRVVIVVQLMNCLRFIFRILGTFIVIRVEVGCRAMLFLNALLTTLPVNLSVYCVVYLQIVIIHRVHPHKRWSKAVPLTFALLIVVVPAVTFLYLPPARAGVSSFCNISKIFNHTAFVFYNITVGLWEYLSGAIGVASIITIGVYIFRAQRVPQSLLRTSAYSYDPSRTITQQSQTNMLHRTLVAMIWYPITPIIALWFNLILSTVTYHTKRTYTWLEYINVILFGLQSVLLGLGLLVSPSIQRAFKREIWRRWIRPEKKARAIRAVASSTGRNVGQEFPRLNGSSALSLDDDTFDGSTISDIT